ncbi:MAG: type II toxin-antitoxin system prevent-host-death family antitoxin [Deltaproteobacteria bacterium]|jgi:prevent-host-death family protein|nr:type II toxin-antitoxin system prevent-host-death family antitoxin [Deltaproteobacteria bacterium]MBT4265669.1 type II toxin-antitoxin system prevent-host-death family antitoxin [Deltaproteobacteria bacterium]MBT4637252.1 type II toxin-antitoxin system prevent-host-death family antitoxin [Deltaproteobacteria bacterium]MBT6501205.1 type II toxin-antitoxin system prevent-host-death family antitoxin [Deltaproteobacteria bacterium]MBT7716048.1 type II toxin-antitoxin system prevent-host-death fa
MKTVSVREAREKIGSLLDAVSAGENIVITRRGKPVAQLTAIETEDTRIRFPDRTKFREQISSSRINAENLIRDMRDERG